MTNLTMSECPHEMGDPMWCSLCRKNLGYRPGTDRHANDCTVITVATLTGASYEEALELLSEAGRRNGKGTSSEAVTKALEAAGWTVTPSSIRLEALPSSGSYYVSAHRGRQGHAFAVVNGEPVNAGKFLRPGTSYRSFKVS